MSAHCSQCGNPSMYEMKGHLLCLSCYERVQSLQFQQLEQLAAAYNLAAADMEYITGFSGSIPRMQIPKQPIHYNPVNIQIDRSVVGTVNTGQIQQLDVAVTNLKELGHTDLSKALQEFTQEVVSSNEIQKETRDQILEQLSFLVEQATVNREHKVPSVVRAVLERLSQIVSAAAGMQALWEKLYVLLKVALS